MTNRQAAEHFAKLPPNEQAIVFIINDDTATLDEHDLDLTSKADVKELDADKEDKAKAVKHPHPPQVVSTMNTSTKHLRGKALWTQLVNEQRQWIEQCGGDLAGYIAKYHEKHGRSLDNAKAIYDADLGELKRREDRLAECR